MATVLRVHHDRSIGGRSGRRAIPDAVERTSELPASLDDPRFNVFASRPGPPTLPPRGTVLQRAGTPIAGLLVPCLGASRQASMVVALDDVQVRTVPAERLAEFTDREADATSLGAGLQRLLRDTDAIALHD